MPYLSPVPYSKKPPIVIISRYPRISWVPDVMRIFRKGEQPQKKYGVGFGIVYFIGFTPLPSFIQSSLAIAMPHWHSFSEIPNVQMIR
jgi:hypothetical protein